MTWITNESGTRWVDVPQRKRRKPPRNLRFADIAVGRQLVQRPSKNLYRGFPLYYVVTDIWFDPVAGQTDPVKGEMIGLAQVKEDGSISGRKIGYPVRGLAPQGFHYADVDYIAQGKARQEGLADGKVIGIRFGAHLKNRPKLPGL